MDLRPAKLGGLRAPGRAFSAKNSRGVFAQVKGSFTLEKLEATCRAYSVFLVDAEPSIFLRDFEQFFFLRFGAVAACLQEGTQLGEKEHLFMTQMVLPAVKRFICILLNKEEGVFQAFALLEKYENRLLRSEFIFQGGAGSLYREATAFFCRSILPTVVSLCDGAAGLGEGNMKTTFFYRILQYGVKDAFAFSGKSICNEASEIFRFKAAMIPYVAAYFLFASTEMKWCTEDLVNRRNPLHDLMPLKYEDSVWMDFRDFSKKHPVVFAGQMLFLEEELLSRIVEGRGSPINRARQFYKDAIQKILNPLLMTLPAP